MFLNKERNSIILDNNTIHHLKDLAAFYQNGNIEEYVSQLVQECYENLQLIVLDL